MSDARKREEEALEEHDAAVAGDEWAFAPISLAVADALRSLLAEETAPPADAATEAVRMLRHLCNVYGCTSYGRKPDHGPDDCSWCEAEALLSTPAPAPSAKEGRT